jgi:hypothetical protein
MPGPAAGRLQPSPEMPCSARIYDSVLRTAAMTFRQEAWRYSLIRPLRTSCRQNRPAWRSAVARAGRSALSGGSCCVEEVDGGGAVRLDGE